MKTAKLAGVVSVALLVACETVSPTIINVPQKQATVQLAIDAARSGDTVLVEPGTYLENINFNGKNICLASLYLTTGDSAYISATVLDGSSSGEVVLFESSEDSSASLVGFTIRRGNAQSGGGIACIGARPLITHNVITENAADLGAGIACWFANPTILDNVICQNVAQNVGGGIALWSSGPVIESNTICHNVIAADPAVYGAGIACHESDPQITRNIINNNIGGGIGCSNSNAAIEGNIIAANTAEWGAGIYCTSSNPSISGNTIAYNSAVVGGGLLLRNSFPTVMERNIIAFSRQGGAIDCADNTPTPSISCCNIFGNSGGDWVGQIDSMSGVNGNSSLDPQFCDTAQSDFHLSESSPCAAENSECGVLVGALSVHCSVTDVDEDHLPGALPLHYSLAQNYPNPFNPVTTVEYTLASRSQVEIEVYNILGQRVRTLVDDDKSVGSYTTLWDGTDQSGRQAATGVYFYRLRAGDFQETKKMLLLK